MKVEPIVIPIDSRENIVLLPVPITKGKNLFRVRSNFKLLPSIDVPNDKILPYFFLKRTPRSQSTSVLFIVNDRCNLSCIYCFETKNIDSVRSKQELSLDQALPIVDTVFKNALDSGMKSVSISFFGGEPTLSIPVIQKIISYAQILGSRYDISPKFGITTNGRLDNSILDYVKNTFNTIIFSLDGPSFVHNNQRPTAGGKESFDNIFKNAKILYKTFGPTLMTFRVTISQKFLEYLPQIIDFYESEFPGAYIHIEPALDITSNDIGKSFYAQFSKLFMACLWKCETVRIHHSTLFFKFKEDPNEIDFCGASRSNFYITPTGEITACTRIIRKTDPGSERFFTGKFSNGTISFYPNTENELALLSLSHIDNCEGCFAKYNCKGGCPSLKVHAMGKAMGAPWMYCDEVRNLTKNYLLFLLEKDRNVE